MANNITRNVTELGQEARCAERSEKRFLGLAFVAGSIARTADHAGTYTGLISSAFPLANIILPIVLPLLIAHAHQIEERCAPWLSSSCDAGDFLHRCAATIAKYQSRYDRIVRPRHDVCELVVKCSHISSFDQDDCCTAWFVRS